MYGSLFWKRGTKDVPLVETACAEACVRGRVLCTRGRRSRCVSSAGNMRGRKTRDEDGKVSRDQSHGEPLWEKGAEAVAPKISLYFQKTILAADNVRVQPGRVTPSEPQFSAPLNSHGTTPDFEVIKIT